MTARVSIVVSVAGILLSGFAHGHARCRTCETEPRLTIVALLCVSLLGKMPVAAIQERKHTLESVFHARDSAIARHSIHAHACSLAAHC